ncbi:hypothetical protein [Plasmodium yoelii yoelii]|uniref:Uncharacterized protein n=1 Tax=Plasmodium yoelii yoelii TaxID=73239 RepID=Q7R7I0_PLAYO|nr:hypothetical protein [Plasmodium yoelii yoelii]
MQEDLDKYVKKNKNLHDEYEINSIDINNGKFRYRSLSENCIEKDYTSGCTTTQKPSHNKKFKGLKISNIFKRNKNKITKAPSYSKIPPPYPYNQITETSPDNNKFLPRVTIVIDNVPCDFIPRTSKDLRFLLRMKKKIDKQSSKDKKFHPLGKLKLKNDTVKINKKHRNHLLSLLDSKKTGKQHSNNKLNEQFSYNNYIKGISN